MKFLQNCFIRKNTPELREKLRKNGIRWNDFDDNRGEWLAYNSGMCISVSQGHERVFPDHIDCGLDEEMFLALTALRDDTDIHQWFICKGSYKSQGDLGVIEEGTWHKMNLRSLPYCLARRWRKATVEEILEHFRKEKAK